MVFFVPSKPFYTSRALCRTRRCKYALLWINRYCTTSVVMNWDGFVYESERKREFTFFPLLPLSLLPYVAWLERLKSCSWSDSMRCCCWYGGDDFKWCVLNSSFFSGFMWKTNKVEEKYLKKNYGIIKCYLKCVFDLWRVYSQSMCIYLYGWWWHFNRFSSQDTR